METQTKALDSVNLAAYNPRVDLQPTDTEWADIEASLDEFGQVLALVWNKRTGNLVAGHQRLRIMRHKGRTEAVFTVVDLDAAAEKRLNLVLNKVTGRWNHTKLGELLADLRTQRLDLDRLGFTPLELNRVLGSHAKKMARDKDNAPAPPAIARTVTGDLYEFTGTTGNAHRMLCGDSRQPEAVARLMNGTLARLVFTDPPYGVDYDNSTRGDGRRPLGKVAHDAEPTRDFRELLRLAFTHAHAHSMPEAALYTFLVSATHMDFELSLNAAGWRVKQQIIWAKHFALSRADYHYAHEPCLYAAKAGQSTEWFGSRAETTLLKLMPENGAALKKLGKEELLRMLTTLAEGTDVWSEARHAGADYVHPTQKPTGLAKRAILNSSRPGEAVLDLFAGSGSTAVAAEIDDRLSFSMEESPHHCDVIARRFLETFEGSTATLNGEPFTLPS